MVCLETWTLPTSCLCPVAPHFNNAGISNLSAMRMFLLMSGSILCAIMKSNPIRKSSSIGATYKSHLYILPPKLIGKSFTRCPSMGLSGSNPCNTTGSTSSCEISNSFELMIVICAPVSTTLSRDFPFTWTGTTKD